MCSATRVTCLCCGEVYEGEMCPRRYLTPHSVAFAVAVAVRLQDDGVVEHPTRVQLREAIGAVREEQSWR